MIDTWNIYIAGGYGSFEFVGTESEAEQMRGNKAEWEHAFGWKYRITNQTPFDAVTKEIVDLFERGEGAPSDLMEKWRKLNLQNRKNKKN